MIDYSAFFPPELQRAESPPTLERFHAGVGLMSVKRYANRSARAKVVVLHGGGGGNSALLAPAAVILHRVGYEAVAPDLPGFGDSPAPTNWLYDAWVSAVVALVDRERSRDDRPIVLMGASLGGMLAYHVAAELAARGEPVTGILATTLCDTTLPIVREQFARWPWLGRFGVPLLLRAARVFPKLRMPMRWLANMNAIANDPALARAIASDPTGGGNRVSLEFLASLFRYEPALSPERYTASEVILAHPAADRWTGVEASLPFFERLACTKKLVMLENCGHCPIEQPGMETLMREASGLLERVSSGPSTSPSTRFAQREIRHRRNGANDTQQ